MYNRRQAGFTLAELLIALAITAILANVTFAAFRVSVRLWKQFQTRAELDMALVYFVDRLDKDIRASRSVVSISATELILQQESSYVRWLVQDNTTSYTIHRYVSATNGDWQAQPRDIVITVPRSSSAVQIQFGNVSNNSVTYTFSDGISQVTGRANLRAPSS
jgi:prepilin-type N-terminal cleavage/methylation domain-containing protein